MKLDKEKTQMWPTSNMTLTIEKLSLTIEIRYWHIHVCLVKSNKIIKHFDESTNLKDFLPKNTSAYISHSSILEKNL